MFSYRHAFHAGNHADVLKHFIAIYLINYMGQKEAPFTYIDTHAGAGLYSLDTGYAAKNTEYATGIAKLWEQKNLPSPLADYVNVVKSLNPSGKLRYYPGSPYCAESLLRMEDRLRLFEMHASEVKILHENMHKREMHQAEQGKKARGKRVMVLASDGYDGLKALLPPQQRRALVLMDPPYEDKRDYKRVKDALSDALQRFPGGTYAVWYPVLQRQESREFARKLAQLPAESWLHVTLSVSQPMPDGFGLHSSGMFIINPPWTMEAMLKEVMPKLVELLGNDSMAQFSVESGEKSAEKGAAKAASNLAPPPRKSVRK